MYTIVRLVFKILFQVYNPVISMFFRLKMIFAFAGIIFRRKNIEMTTL